ncbi:hypothetical protein PIB30_087097 [Stylosanthes scabra]|uniref:Uncharacterized protein n=1 Tax=Stylosanthes scabra TaxID=79078 RepID=A0ABU6YSU9_9FABA|nr:hypothetical protein [Stylosanthes scabra]
MRGEDVRAEDIIADKIMRMAQGIKEKGKLGFPSTIYNLCKEAGVPLREFRRTKKIQAKKPITAKRIESTSLQRPPQPNFEHHQEFNEPPVQPPLYHVPTYTDQLANPNLVEMSSQKIVKQIYDNIDRKRPMFRGLLKSDLQPPNPAPPTSSSKDPQDPASSSKDPKDPPK